MSEEMISIYPIGSVGYWTDKQLSDLKKMSDFEKSDEGRRIMCKDYLIKASVALSEKNLSLQKIEEGHDLHCFLRINDGPYENKFLHLQAYTGMINTSSKERNILVSAYIKKEPVDNTPNIGSSWQKQLSLDNDAELKISIENILR